MSTGIESRKTFLLGVQKINYHQLPENFIFYDTLYLDENGKIENYPLPKTDLIILTLFTASEQSPRVWTTVRRFEKKKYDYYSGLIGKEIEIKIEV